MKRLYELPLVHNAPVLFSFLAGIVELVDDLIGDRQVGSKPAFVWSRLDGVATPVSREG
jgi:hypothetical protein